jgi:hypothetical protein
MGVVQFNKGAQVLIDATATVISQTGPSSQLLQLAKKMDRTCLHKADLAAKLESKSSRKRKSLLKMQTQAKQSEEEGHLYKPGAW